MKKTFLLSIAMGMAALPLMAQPVLNQFNTPPQAGNSYLYVRTDYIAPGPDGSGVSHAISSAVGFDSLEFTIDDAQNSPAADSFPGSTHTIYSSHDDFFTFVRVLPNGLENLGENYQAPPGIYPKDDPKTLLPFPTQLGSTATDSFSSVDPHTGFTIHNRGTTFFECTADGQLTTPFGSYSNVVKLHVEEISVDSIVDSTGSFQSTITTVKDLYYQPGNPLPIVESVVKDFTFFQDSFSLVLVDAVVGRPEAAAFSFSISPNPADDVVHVRMDHVAGKSVQYVLRDVHGRELLSGEKRMASGGDVPIFIGHLASGMYFLTVDMKGMRTTARIVRE